MEDSDSTYDAFDLQTPEMTGDDAAPGKRVRQVAPEYAGTEVYHTLYLPVDWMPGVKYPVVVEFTGNKSPSCGSTGEVKDANLGYGLSGGRGLLWVSLPYVAEGGGENAVTWWGDRQATVDYCKDNPEGNVISAHTDLWMHKDSEYRRQARDWLREVTAF